MFHIHKTFYKRHFDNFSLMDMGFVYLFTIGFEEKYVIRSVVERGIEGIEEIYLVSNKNPPERTRKAVEMISITLKNLGLAGPNLIYLDISNMYRAIGALKSHLMKILKGRKLVANISGGMKILSYIVISSLMQLNIDAEIEVLREDMEMRYVFPINIFKGYPIDSIDVDIINYIYIRGGARVIQISDELGYSKATISRRTSKLIALGLLKKEDNIINIEDTAYMYIKYNLT